MIVSLICSVIIWVYVASVETEEFKQTFRGVRVQLVGETLLRDSKNLVITDMDTSTVTVEVVGPRRVVGSLDSDQIYAQIDVSKLSRAAYTSQQYSVIFPDGTETGSLSVTTAQGMKASGPKSPLSTMGMSSMKRRSSG